MPMSIDGVQFPYGPTAVDWGYTLKSKDWKTLGGKVIQLFGIKMGDLVISSSFATAEQQLEWFARLKAIADAQVPKLGQPAPVPVRFQWTERDWDFWVFLKSFSQRGGQTSVLAKNEIVRIDWTLTMFIEQDNTNIVAAAEAAAGVAYIKRISAGMGWEQTAWNGPIVNEEFQAALENRTILQYLYDEHERAYANDIVIPAPIDTGSGE